MAEPFQYQLNVSAFHWYFLHSNIKLTQDKGFTRHYERPVLES